MGLAFGLKSVNKKSNNKNKDLVEVFSKWNNKKHFFLLSWPIISLYIKKVNQ